MPFKRSLSRGQILLGIVHREPDHPFNRFADRIDKLVVNTKTSGGAAKNGKNDAEEYSVRVYYKEGAAPECTSATIDGTFGERYDIFVVSLNEMVSYTTGAGACRDLRDDGC